MTTQPPACGKISELAPCPFCGATDSESLTGLAIHHKHGCFLQKRIGSTYLAASEHAAWNLRQPSASPAPMAEARASMIASRSRASESSNGMHKTAVRNCRNRSSATGAGQTRDFLMHRKIWSCVEKAKPDCDCYMCVKFVAAITCFDRLAALSAQPSGALERENAETSAQEIGELHCGAQGHEFNEEMRCILCGANSAPPERAPGGDALNMDDLSDARAYFEKAYRYEATTFPGTSKIAAGQYRRYADAVAIAAIRLSRTPPPSSSPSATCDATSSVAIATLRAALEKDAARYRWLRSKGAWKHIDPPGPSGISLYWEYGAESDENDPRLDAVIDAGIARDFAALAGNEGEKL